MNHSLAIFLISDKARAIQVTYNKEKKGDINDHPKYTFKTFDRSIKVDDYVIVQTDTRHGMTVCKVMEVDVEPDFDSDLQFKWIIGRVFLEDFKDLEQQENDAILKIKKAEKRRRREELRKDLMADAGDELTALPIYSQLEEKEPKDMNPGPPEVADGGDTPL